MEIIYEDNHLIAVNKNVGEIVQSDPSGDKPLDEMVKEYLVEKYNKPGDAFLGVAHRIDRPVSGIVLFARTSKALARLNQMFQDKGIVKTYWAIVKNLPEQPEGTINHYLTRDTKKNKATAFDKEVKNSKPASLSYKVVVSSDNYHLLEIDLHTGRHHQIRCQLAKIGCPIKGDLKYGFARSNPDGGICLHARSLSFIHPVGKLPVHIEAPVPDDKLWKFFEEEYNKLYNS
jgi:23S rRNA pseudouridine1911/1915/1917 synthase